MSEINKKYRFAAPLVLTLGLLLAGCGGQGAGQEPEFPPSQKPELELLPLPSETAIETELQVMAVRSWENLDWEHKTYTGTDQFLQEQGFDGADPFYTCQDQEGMVQLVLYYNEETGGGCGIRYTHGGSGETEPHGFAFAETGMAWEARDAFSAARWDRWEEDYAALPEWKGGDAEDYRETCVHDEAGRVAEFEASARFEGYGTEDRLWIYSARYTYDENGTLRQRHLGQNPRLFAANDSSWDSYFDAQGRVCYERGYLTHGSQEYYYIYADEGTAPVCCLYLDEDCGVWGPVFVRY